MSDPLVALVTALADDELILGHRHSEWTGYAPHIEEDVAFSSIAQDEIGHAAAYYSLVAKIAGDDPDRLGLGREVDEYRNAILCERPNREWSFTLARHWVYDTADSLRLESLQDTAHDELRALVEKIRREERYHTLHADSWMKRVAQGPVEGRRKLVDAVGEVLEDAAGLFEPFELEDQAVKEGWLPAPSDELRTRFFDAIARYLDELGFPTEVHAHADERAEFVASSSGDLIATDAPPAETHVARGGLGGRRGRHTEDFDALWAEMTKTYRLVPGATW